MQRSGIDAITHAVTRNGFSSRPWEVSDELRPDLLDWFMDANFAQGADLELLTALNGPRRGPWSQETALRAQAMTALASGLPTFVAFYTEIRRLLRNTQDYWRRATSESSRAQKELLATLAFRQFKDLREEVTSLEVERHSDTGAVVWPAKGYPAPRRRAGSLAGELASAMYDRMLGARTAGVCDVCHEPWLSRRAKPRGRARQRRLCGRPTCWATWRSKHRKPEDPKKVIERVRRWRKAETLRLAKKAGKTK